MCDLGLAATYTGDRAEAAIHSEALDQLAARLGAPSIRAWACYLRGERHAQHDPATAIHELVGAVSLAEDVDDRFLAGAARHTLLTTAASADAANAITSLAVLIDQWRTAGAWTQLWLTIRVLIETLSRHRRHREATILLAACDASPQATPTWGADADRLSAVAAAARDSLGEAFETAWAEGTQLGDAAAITLAVTITHPTSP